jgi:hypothetical protein
MALRVLGRDWREPNGHGRLKAADPPRSSAMDRSQRLAAR